MTYLRIVTAALLICLSASLHADVLASWNNNGLAADTTVAPATTVHGNISAPSITLGAGLGPVNWPDVIGTRPSTATSGNLTDAITNDDFLTFTITPDGSVTDLDYTSLDIRIDAADSVTYTLMADAVGAFTAGNEITSFVHTASGGLADETFNVNLTGVTGLQNITGAVEFRLYVHSLGGSTFQTGIGDSFDAVVETDLEIQGNITTGVVPEPATALLFGLGSIGLFLARRQRTA